MPCSKQNARLGFDMQKKQTARYYKSREDIPETEQAEHKDRVQAPKSDDACENGDSPEQENSSVSDLEEEREIEALSHLENKRLFEEYSKAADENDLESINKIKWKIVVANTSLIYRIAWPLFRKFRCESRGFEIDDLVSSGYEGVRRAITTYDPEKGFTFGTYAGWWIRNYIVRYIHDNDRTMRVPQYLHEKIPKIRLAEDYFITQGRGQPSDKEIADRLGWAIKNVTKIRNVIRSSVSSLDSQKGQDDDLDPYNYYPDKSTDPEKALITEAKQNIIRSLLDQHPKAKGGLKQAERCILKLRFGLSGENEKILVKIQNDDKGKIFKEIKIEYDGHEKILEEIGEIFGVTRERIRQIEVNALKKLRRLYYHKVIKHTDPSQITVEELSIIKSLQRRQKTGFAGKGIQGSRDLSRDSSDVLRSLRRFVIDKSKPVE